jgi:hypothetical protein
MMSGAHADIEAVFDYAPDAKLLAAAAKADDYDDEDAGQSGYSERTGQSVRSGDSDIEESGSETDDDSEQARPLPIIARDTVDSPPDGILSVSPQRTKTLNTQITFDSHSPDRRRSLPAVTTGTGEIPAPRRGTEGQSVLQRLYGIPPPNPTLDSTVAGTRGSTWDANPPSWVLELNATLRAIEERQRHLEQILGGARSPGTASAAGSDAGIDPA